MLGVHKKTGEYCQENNPSPTLSKFKSLWVDCIDLPIGFFMLINNLRELALLLVPYGGSYFLARFDERTVLALQRFCSMGLLWWNLKALVYVKDWSNKRNQINKKIITKNNNKDQLSAINNK